MQTSSSDYSESEYSLVSFTIIKQKAQTHYIIAKTLLLSNVFRSNFSRNKSNTHSWLYSFSVMYVNSIESECKFF